MIKNIFPYLLFAVLSGLCVTGLHAQEVSITGFTAVKNEEALVVSFDVDFGGLSLKSSSCYAMLPVLVSKDSTRNKRLPSIALMGKNRYEVHRRRADLKDMTMQFYSLAIKYRKNTGDILRHYSTSIPFEEWMYGAGVSLHKELVACSDCTKDLGLVRLGSIEEKPEPAAPRIERPGLFMTAPLQTEKKRMVRQDAYLNFQSAKTKVLSSYMNNSEELAKIYNSIDSILGDKEYRLNMIRLTGYASPEGGYSINAWLSEGRAMGLKRHLDFKYDLGPDKIKVASVPENWNGLVQWLKESSPSYADDVLEIIHSVSNEDQRELRIRQKFPTAYKELLAQAYPKLRKVEYQIDYAIIPFSVEEGRLKVWTAPARMSAYELYQVACSYGVGSTEYNQIIMMTAVLYPTDKAVINNAVLVAYDTQDYATMYKYLRQLEGMK